MTVPALFGHGWRGGREDETRTQRREKNGTVFHDDLQPGCMISGYPSPCPSIMANL